MRIKNAHHDRTCLSCAAGRALRLALGLPAVGCQRVVGGKHSGALDAKEFVNGIRLGTKSAASDRLDLHLPVGWRVVIPRRYGRLLDAQPAGGFGLSPEELDNFLCSHGMSIAVAITQKEGES